MAEVQHAYRYAGASALDDRSGPHLALVTSATGALPTSHFFEGRVHQPRLVADALTAVHLIVGSRFFTPPNMLAKRIALADPVVTSGGGVLRFEGFSACCSAYIRVDLGPEGYAGEVTGKGTTNVDFNAPMRAALARVRDDHGLGLSVGSGELTLATSNGSVTERKVALPERWVRGMLEVQAFQAGMTPRLEAGSVESLRFLRALPRASTARTPLWIARGAAGLITTTRAVEGGVRVTDSTRLRVLEPLLPGVRHLRVYADPSNQASAWVLDFDGMRVSLVLSAETWRGFSGEGQSLYALMRLGNAGNHSVLDRVRAQLNWQHLLRVDGLALSTGLPGERVADALHALGASGLVGYDVAEQGYFHRVLPFDLSGIEDAHPRLAAARELLEHAAVHLDDGAVFAATVDSDGGAHRVRAVDAEIRCTCPWFARHGAERGPCKHVLAARSAWEARA
ncbi:SWIM zinc finger family protein [Luteibacter sp.]|mgnify:CR=1 FL=1|uniref:SWIM zinc finger family protein n=1 Tax=Luteibacter sp. TaxID=1886636 RepID=UPI002806A912|nr:SWIM zinc finger family protein [Luteibacter sp.]MDQ8048938.1 SWIM zinc finger family protein [Luteibacter sp.]